MVKHLPSSAGDMGSSPGPGTKIPSAPGQLSQGASTREKPTEQKILCAGRCRAAQLMSIRLMSGQVSRGSAGEYQADERAGVARLS